VGRTPEVGCPRGVHCTSYLYVCLRGPCRGRCLDLWGRQLARLHRPRRLLSLAGHLSTGLPGPTAGAPQTSRHIVKHCEWTDVEPPQDLREAFVIHTARTRESQRNSAYILEGYKNPVRIALADGFVTREEVQQLAALRHHLDITRADHERIMSELAEEEHDVRANLARQVLAASGGNAHRMAAGSTAAANGASSPMQHRTMASSDHGTPSLP
jgi:hypothetical protein